MYTQDFPEPGDFRGPSTSSSSFTWIVWHRHRARKNSSSRSCKAQHKTPHVCAREAQGTQRINDEAGVRAGVRPSGIRRD